MWENRKMHTLLVECKLIQQNWKIILQLLKFLNIDLLRDAVGLLLGIYPEKIKTYIHKISCTQMLLSAFFITAFM